MARFSLAYFLKEKGGREAEAEALRLFEEVRAKYADLPHPYDPERGSLGDAAEREQFEMERLRVGKQAPRSPGKT